MVLAFVAIRLIQLIRPIQLGNDIQHSTFDIQVIQHSAHSTFNLFDSTQLCGPDHLGLARPKGSWVRLRLTVPAD